MNREQAESVLKRIFKHSKFHNEQWETIEKILKGEKVLLIEKTGFGKSLCFQFPAVVFSGTTVIFSPLIALMRDQVKKLKSLGISAECINSEQSPEQNSQIIDSAKQGKIKILYIAPERQENSEWIEATRQMKLSMVVVDEAHCISQYGNDFRPKYKQVAVLREFFNVPCIALTATADSKTVEDIKKTLKFNQNNFEFVEYNQNLDRPNLHYNVIKKVGDGFKQINHILDSYDKDSSGIIYCTTKKQTEELAYKLYKKGYKVKAYHSAVKKNEKEQILTEWLENKLQIVIATSAFGTGINKPDTKFVICTTLTPTVEDLVQSLGRAGRDGSDTYVYLLHSPEDIKLIKWMIKNTNLPMSQLENKLTKLQDVQKIVNSKNCIRKQLLSYFNQEYPEENCESCSNCVKSIPL